MFALKLTLTAALMFVAAVLFPLRRAQQAFASRAESPAVSNAGRPKLRRRPGTSRVVVREATTANERDLPVTKAVYRGTPRRRRTVVTPSHVGTWSARKSFAASPIRSTTQSNGQSHHAAAAQDDYAPPGRATWLPQPERLAAPAPSQPLAVSTQVIGDIPEPPPKHSL